MGSSKYRVYICTGPNCGPKGSGRLIGLLEAELERLEIRDSVSVTGGGCQSHCETGPTMVVFPGPVFYERVDRARLERIAIEHLAGGEPVTEYFWDKNRQPHKIIPGREFSKGFDPSSLGRTSVEGSSKQKSKPRKAYEVDDFKW